MNALVDDCDRSALVRCGSSDSPDEPKVTHQLSSRRY